MNENIFPRYNGKSPLSRGLALLACLLLSACAGMDDSPAPSARTGPDDAGASLRYHPRPDYYRKSGPPSPRPYLVLGKWYQPLAHADGFVQRGIASWYGEDFHGKPTSSGEIYDMDGISAAHKILPLHTWVRVSNLENGKEMVLRINDRGPFVAGRIIDLSRGAARQLGVYGPGTARVEIEALGVAPPPPDSVRMATFSPKPVCPAPQKMSPVNLAASHFQIQVGAFGKKETAEKLAARLRESHTHADVKPTPHSVGKSLLYRVLVGRYASLEEAARYEKRLQGQGFSGAFTIAE